MSTTGVVSYGDLMANHSGLQFWLSLTDGANPLFKCMQGQWKQVRPFDFSQYVNSGWDEAINCSEFREYTAKAVEKNQETLEKKSAQRGKKDRYLCPVSTGECKKLSKQFKKYESYLLSYDCREARETDKPGQRVNAQVPSSKVSPVKASSKSATGGR